MMDSTKEKK